jgi:hypothetical protein
MPGAEDFAAVFGELQAQWGATMATVDNMPAFWRNLRLSLFILKPYLC